MAYQTNSIIIDKVRDTILAIKDTLETVTIIKEVSLDVTDLQRSKNYPLVVLWENGIEFGAEDLDAVCSLTIYVKTKYKNFDENREVIKAIFDSLDSLTGDYIYIEPVSLTNEAELYQGSSVGTKSIVSTIEIEIKI